MLLVGLLALPAHGQISPRVPEIARATEQIDQGEFEEAVRTLQKGLSTQDLTDDQLVELYRLLGLSQLYLGNEERAREAYEKLLQARPDFELPKSEPPKIRNLFTRIKEDIKKRRVRPVTLTVDGIAEVAPDEPLAIGARIEDLPLGAKAKFFYRRAGQQSYSSVDFARRKGSREEFAGIVPAFEIPTENTAYEIEWYVEVADGAQRRLAGKGDAFTPLSFKVLPKGVEPGAARAEAIPVYKSPWFWIGIGAGVAAVTTGVVLLATQKQYGTMTFTVPIAEAP
jgi:tetratricopeptide (TPR) repeat protein